MTTSFSSTQRCNIGTVLQPFETISYLWYTSRVNFGSIVVSALYYICQTFQANCPFESLLMTLTSNNLHNLESVMNEEFKLVVKYCAVNKLSGINFSKTNYILVSSSRLSGSINVNNIKIKSQLKYLGVYIERHLHWGPQIKHINNKLAKNIGIITKLRHYVNLHTMKQLYYSFTYPYLTYANTSWGGACKTNLNRIRTTVFIRISAHEKAPILKAEKVNKRPAYQTHCPQMRTFALQ